MNMNAINGQRCFVSDLHVAYLPLHSSRQRSTSPTNGWSGA